MPTSPATTTAAAHTITVQPWPDPVIDAVGHDPRSVYVETFWLPTLGPTSVLLLRRLADLFEQSPDGAQIAVAETSRQLGLGEREGATSPLLRTLKRLEQFGLARVDEDATVVQVRRAIPPIAQRHVRRLPPSLVRAHDRYLEESLDDEPTARARARARRLAFVLLETGDESATIERALLLMGFAPTVAVGAVRWAVSRHLAAKAALSDEAA